LQNWDGNERVKEEQVSYKVSLDNPSTSASYLNLWLCLPSSLDVWFSKVQAAARIGIYFNLLLGS
jgi:hypothetical protein